MSLTKSRLAKVSAGVVGFAMALSFVVAPVTASAATVAELQAQIAALSAQLASLSSTTTTTTSTGYTFNVNLTVGSTGADVMNLQKVLNRSADTRVAVSGVGSAGMESSYFGALTKAAVMKFQAKYGISPVAGYVGPITRAKLNSMNVSSSSSTTTTTTTTGTFPAGCSSSTGYSSTTGQSCATTTTTPVGGSLSVSAGTQPTNSLAPQNAARIPFTTVVLTAGATDVTVNSVTVERVGLAQDAVLSGVVLLNSDGMQIGIAKTLNSNHQAVVGEPWVIKAGTSQTVTIAGNMAASLSAYAGQVVGLNVVGVNTTASISGSFPIMGAQHTVNASLALGTVTLATSSFDPQSAQTKEIGTSNYKFAGVRVTAGSAEQVKLWSVRFNQSGSASSNDLANVVVVVDGVSYPTVVSADGKYYSAVFSGGLLIDKGLSKDVYIKGDIVGTSAAGRTIQFDLYKNTDLYLSGVTYGYGIIGTNPNGGSAVVATTASEFVGTAAAPGSPFFSGSVVTVSAGSVTSIQKATSVAAQNIAVNVPNQVLGGFVTDIKGEPITVQSMAFTIATTGTVGPITSITIVDQNGAVVAGPVDEASTCTTGCTVTFTDSVTFPVGQRTYTIKGKIPSGASNGATVIVSANPSTGWTNVTGQTTGNSISLAGSGSFAMNTMTVKAASLAVSVSATPSAQSIVAGAQAVLLANYQFDASQSGEDVRFSSLQVTNTGSNSTGLTSCQLFDGATALNTGSNVVTTLAGSATFTFDQQLVVPKGTVKTLALKCNVSSSATGTFILGITGTQVTAMTVTGVSSSGTVVATGATATGQTMTVGTGALVVSTDSSSPSYTVVAGGSTGNVAGAYKFRASNEAVNLNRVSLKLTSGAASDVVQVTIWDGGTQVGTAVFTGNSLYATSTFSSSVVLPKDTDKVLTVKVDLAAIGTSQPGTEGSLVKVDFNGSDSTGTQGTGAGSGNTINATGSTAVAGVRMFKSFPTLALDTLGSTGLADGKLMRFKVTANANGSVGVSQFKFTVSTTTAVVTNIGLYAYTDAAYASAISGQGTSGQIGSNVTTATNGTAFAISPSTNPVQVSAGQTLYFELRASVSGVTTGASVVTTLLGDSAYLTNLTAGYNVATSSAATSTSNFVWSGNATSTAGLFDVDWSNGYGLPGLSASGLIQTRSN
ncbi:peptidoglycan-binding protein [Patescibacteria group bacterium]|nr:peptidoglycan-binding protein [Patescibacteria group bacterium]